MRKRKEKKQKYTKIHKQKDQLIDIVWQLDKLFVLYNLSAVYTFLILSLSHFIFPCNVIA